MHQLSNHKIESVLNQVTDNCCVHWVSAGDWSLHDLLIGVLLQTGPSEVYISSYSFSEQSSRIIADLKSRKIITRLHCLIDSRIDKRSGGVLSLIRDCADSCRLINTHAKVTVISGKTLEVAIVGSANYTTNIRYEAGIVVANSEVAQFYKDWMLYELNKV